MSLIDAAANEGRLCGDMSGMGPEKILPKCLNETLYRWEVIDEDYEFYSQKTFRCPRCKRTEGFKAKYCWYCGAKFSDFDKYICRDNIDE